MKDSLCAHCKHTEQVAYSGFFCNETGYCENKTVAEGCQAFEPDAIDEMTCAIKEKLIRAYPNAAVFTPRPSEPARWLSRKRNGYAVLVCSACEALKEGYTHTAYCPHCGRPMTGGEAQG